MESPTILDGKTTAATIREELKGRVARLVAEGCPTPCLVVFQVGARPDSSTYVRMKQRAAEAAGMAFQLRQYDETVTQEELVAAVVAANEDAAVHGIIVQLPLPHAMEEAAVTSAVASHKDVDGFQPVHIGNLALRGHEPLFTSCTPKGCMELLRRYKVELSGKRAVVIGRSNIVGIPMALLLLNANATVTICHSRTVDLPAQVREADVIVAAVGQPLMVQAEWVKAGAVVVDVGINSVPDATRKSGYRLVGDVDYAAVAPKASAITPVPGGVGPMTVAMLLTNTVDAAERAHAQ